MKTHIIIVTVVLAVGVIIGASIRPLFDKFSKKELQTAWAKPDNSPIAYLPIDSTAVIMFGFEEGGNVRWQMVKVGPPK